MSGFLLIIAKFKTSYPSSKLLSNWFTTSWVFLSSLGADGSKRSLRGEVVFCFTGVGSTTLGGSEGVIVGKVVVSFVGCLVVVFSGRLVVVFAGCLAEPDLN